MDIRKINDTTYEAEITLTLIQAGRSPQEAFMKLYESSHDVRMHLARHPEIQEQLIQHLGPKTPEEQLALFKRVLGQKQ